MKPGPLTLFLLLPLVAGVPARATPPEVTVDVTPPQIARRTFDPANPPAQMPRLTPPEVGTCVFKFDCTMETQASGSEQGTARVTKVQVRTGLTITIWTPVGGPERVVNHEEGHRRICEIYYSPARDIAERIGWQAVGAPLSGGTQPELEHELDVLQKHSIVEFLRDTATRCEYAQRRFDAITNHSMNPIPESTAIAQAILEERNHFAGGGGAVYPGTAARAAPTRPSQVRAAE